MFLLLRLFRSVLCWRTSISVLPVDSVTVSGSSWSGGVGGRGGEGEGGGGWHEVSRVREEVGEADLLLGLPWGLVHTEADRGLGWRLVTTHNYQN